MPKPIGTESNYRKTSYKESVCIDSAPIASSSSNGCRPAQWSLCIYFVRIGGPMQWADGFRVHKMHLIVGWQSSEFSRHSNCWRNYLIITHCWFDPKKKYKWLPAPICVVRWLVNCNFNHVFRIIFLHTNKPTSTISIYFNFNSEWHCERCERRR